MREAGEGDRGEVHDTAAALAPAERARLALAVGSTAVVVGVVGDALLRVVPWGLNAPLWLAVLLAGLGVAARLGGRRLRGEGRWLAAPALVLASAFLLRDSETLRFWSGLTVAVTLGLLVATVAAGSLRRRSLAAYLLAPFAGVAHALAGAPVLLLGDLRASPSPGRARWRPVLAAARGALLAIPPLLLFGGLLASADAVFERVVERVLGDLDQFLLHVLVAAFVAWLAAGLLRAALLVEEPRIWAPHARRLALGAVEVGVLLGSLNLLFLAFVVVQLRYLFGGEAHVQATLGLTYAEYARRGFFELVTVAALLLPLLLLLDALRPHDARGQRVFRGLAALSLALLAVIVASALQRMRLYVGEYGLTEMRVYTTAFVLWILATCAWFALTVLRGDHRRFAFGAYAGAVAVLLVLLAANPAAWVVRVNAARAAETGRFDAWYATRLGADAVPPLVRALPRLPAADRCVAAARLLELWPTPRSVDWRGWNRARAAAWRLVAEHREDLRRQACATSGERS